MSTIVSRNTRRPSSSAPTEKSSSSIRNNCGAKTWRLRWINSCHDNRSSCIRICGSPEVRECRGRSCPFRLSRSLVRHDAPRNLVIADICCSQIKESCEAHRLLYGHSAFKIGAGRIYDRNTASPALQRIRFPEQHQHNPKDH